LGQVWQTSKDNLKKLFITFFFVENSIKNQALEKDEAYQQLLTQCEQLKKQRAQDRKIIADVEAELVRKSEEVELLDEEINCIKQRAQCTQEENNNLELALEEVRLVLTYLRYKSRYDT